MNDEIFQLAMRAFDDQNDNDVPVCQEPGCNNSAMECTLTDENGDIHEYYCPEHARENGYCICCGTFIAGWRDFSNWCENCEAEIKNDWEEDDDDYFDPLYGHDGWYDDDY